MASFPDPVVGNQKANLMSWTVDSNGSLSVPDLISDAVTGEILIKLVNSSNSPGRHSAEVLVVAGNPLTASA